MRAIAKLHPAPGLDMIDIAEPAPGPLEVLIKIHRTSICGTDLHIDNWDEWAAATIKPPLVVGHEFVGEIAALGPLTKGFQIGEIVTGEGHLVCGHCRNCLAGRRHLCRDTQGLGIHRQGAFADFLVLPVENVWHADPAIAEDVYGCFDPLGNAVHTALTYDLVGEDVLITGAGPIGCMAAAVARHAGARHVVISDPNPWRLELAKKLGATRTVNPREESINHVMQNLGMQEGFDVGLEMSGHPRALEEMIESMFHGGKIALLGILPKQAAVDWTKIIFNGLTLTGIYGRKIYETWYKTTAMIKSGLEIGPVITHRYSCRDFRQGFALMKAGRCGKVILEWN